MCIIRSDFRCHQGRFASPHREHSIRHLQILAGMERLEYVVLYWILITKIEAILKKKVPKIVTDNLKIFLKNKILKILGKKSIGPWPEFEPTAPTSVGQF